VLLGAGANYATPTRGLVTSSPSTRCVSSVSLTASASDDDGLETIGTTGTALTAGAATGLVAVYSFLLKLNSASPVLNENSRRLDWSNCAIKSFTSEIFTTTPPNV